MNINEIKRLLNKKIAIKVTYCNDNKAISRYVETISRKDFLESFKEKNLKYEKKCNIKFAYSVKIN